MTPKQNQGAGKRRSPAIPLDYYEQKSEQRKTNLFFVFYNGKVTENDYFRSLSDQLAGKERIRSQFLHLKFIQGDPQQVVQAAQAEVNYRKRDVSDQIGEEDVEANDIIWVVFDKDDFRESYSEAVKLAKDSGFRVAYSNICFELWYLLHFQDQDHNKETRRRALTEFLRTKWEEASHKNIESKSNVKHFPYGILLKHGSQQEAIVRAKQLHDKAAETNPQEPWNVNPVTRVDGLVEDLVTFFSG